MLLRNLDDPAPQFDSSVNCSGALVQGSSAEDSPPVCRQFFPRDSEQPDVGPGLLGDRVVSPPRDLIAEMMAKGTYGWIKLATQDLEGTFDQV